MQKKKVVVIDDHTLIRETWSRLLNYEPDFEVILNTGDGEAAVDVIKKEKPEIVLLDINMVPLNGFDILKLIRKYSPLTKVISVSMHSQVAYARKMLREGAKGYVTKNSTTDELMEAIHQVAAGKTYLCREIKDVIAELTFEDAENSTNPLSLLSERELEIIKHLQNGLSSKEIAELLFITPKTVEVHRHRILKKLKTKNTAALIQFLNKHGM